MRLACVLVLLGVVLGAPATPGTAGVAEFQVVVHPTVRGAWISRANLQALFTGKTDRWGDKTAAKPVDQSMKAPVRHAFTSSVLGLSIGGIQRLWQDRVAVQRIFPPPIKSSDAEVLAYVAGTTGAVGYVAAETVIPDGVKVISVVD